MYYSFLFTLCVLFLFCPVTYAGLHGVTLQKYLAQIESNEEALSFDSIWQADTYHDTVSAATVFGRFYENYKRRSKIHTLLDKAPDGSVVVIPDGEYESQLFALIGRKNLTIKGRPGKVWLISTSSTKTIFTLVNCQNIHFDGIGFLHDVEGFCTGNSIELKKCRNISFNRCDISGCGTVGIVANLVDTLSVTNSYLHHCTYQMMDLNEVRQFTLFNTLLSENKETQCLNGIALHSLWGDVVLAHNSFVNNSCAAITFDVYAKRNSRIPLGDGRILLYRNLFNRNNSSESEAITVYEPRYSPNGDISFFTLLQENCFHQQTLEAFDREKDSLNRGEEYEDKGYVRLYLKGDRVGDMAADTLKQVKSIVVELPKESISFDSSGEPYGVLRPIPWLKDSKTPKPRE